MELILVIFWTVLLASLVTMVKTVVTMVVPAILLIAGAAWLFKRTYRSMK